ncbi:hypothetical protein EBH_0029230 [Eimeria brunetti]|uniref:Uncharacterized protein n=1 Tax=Eimeria brunetti TaxID=51314 RepID=U6LMS3_9EIME|nr:hypothetical protein EBH_0029230 [Eimeria brunetti]
MEQASSVDPPLRPSDAGRSRGERGQGGTAIGWLLVQFFLNGKVPLFSRAPSPLSRARLAIEGSSSSSSTAAAAAAAAALQQQQSAAAYFLTGTHSFSRQTLSPFLLQRPCEGPLPLQPLHRPAAGAAAATAAAAAGAAATQQLSWKQHQQQEQPLL